MMAPSVGRVSLLSGLSSVILNMCYLTCIIVTTVGLKTGTVHSNHITPGLTDTLQPQGHQFSIENYMFFYSLLKNSIDFSIDCMGSIVFYRIL